MKTCKAFRFRVYPTPKQIDRLATWDNALRFLWNLANEQRCLGYARPKDERRYPTAFDQINELTELRGALPWLADVPRNVCAQLLIELDKAWQRCFKRIAYAPHWKRKGLDVLSFTEPNSKVWRLDGDIIRFPKIGNIRAVVHRQINGKPKTCTLGRDGKQWFVSLIFEVEIINQTQRIGPIVAVDRGVVNAIATSDGVLISAPRHLEVAMKRLAHAQRTVSRRKKGSKNREKAKARVVVLHRKVRLQRNYFLHGLTSKIAKSHGVVVVEKLQIRNMATSAKGTVEKPGRNVRQKAGLNRVIFSAGWGRMVEMLRYKLAWSGGTLIEVPAAYSSQTCSVCGCVDAKSRVSQSVFYCTSCGYQDHADLNAAKILLTRANRSGLPVEGDGTPRSRKRVGLRVPRRPLESFSL